MIRANFLTALLTGTFCAVFALGIDWLTEMLQHGQIIWIGFLSGFLGSIFAQTVPGRWAGWTGARDGQ